MTQITPPEPLCPIDDDQAALYIGHLAAQAEISMPDAKRDAQIALTWLASHIAETGARLWIATLEDIIVSGQPIGSWKAVARTQPGKTAAVTLERHRTLVEDGRQVMTLAHAFIEQSGQMERGIESLVEFSVMALAAQACSGHRKIEIVDMNGLRISLKLRKKPRLSKISRILFLPKQ